MVLGAKYKFLRLELKAIHRWITALLGCLTRPTMPTPHIFASALSARSILTNAVIVSPIPASLGLLFPFLEVPSPKSYLFFKNYIKHLLFQETFPKFLIWVSCTLLLLLCIFKPWLIFYSNHRFICRSCTKYNLLNNSPESYISLLPSPQWIYSWRSITLHARIYMERLGTFFWLHFTKFYKKNCAGRLLC